MGGYVKSNLISGEQVVYETTLHWFAFVSLRGVVTVGLWPLIDRLTTEFAVTNKRVIVKTGWVRRETLELNLSRVESVSVDQSLMGRLFGYGAITIIGTGGTREPFHGIAHPLEFRKAVQEQLSPPLPTKP